MLYFLAGCFLFFAVVLVAAYWIYSRFQKIGCLVFGAIAFVAFAGFIYWFQYSEFYWWHQKLTVTVETPEGDISASSVSSVTTRSQKFVPGHGRRATGSFEGEATVLDFGEGRYLFALIKDAQYLAQYAVLNEEERKTSSFSKRGNWLEEVGRIGPVPPEQYPMLVTFDDINDPASVKQVDPNDLVASFGEGYHLKSITLEITNEAVTTGEVEKILPCLLSGKSCIQLNKALPYGDPMRHIPNSVFWRNRK